MEGVFLRVVDYNASDLQEEILSEVSEVMKYVNQPSVTWFNMDGLHETKIMEDIVEGFDFDQLVLADVMDTLARPKVR